LILRGEKTGHILTGGDIRSSIAKDTLPASSSVPVELNIINRDALPPDRYVGALRLGLKGTDSPAFASFTLDVRDAPWWALAVLLLGVIVGRLVKNMSTPEALLQVKLLKRLYRLQNVVRALRSERDLKVLLGRLDDLRARIESGSETEQVLTQALDKVEVTARLLNRLEQLKQDAMPLSNVTLREEIIGKVDAAAKASLEGEAGECERLITEIEISLRQAHVNVADDAVAGAHVEGALNSALNASAASEEAREVHEMPPPPSPGVPQRLLAALSGADLMSAGARYWVWKPVFFLLLLALLTLLGLKTLYIDNGANFGVGGIYDYLGLFLWGLSAEVVQRTLQNLPTPGS
jgi:hypothetical protein